MKRIYFFMLMFVNMAAQVRLGAVQINNVSAFEINESVLEMSNTAKVIIPRNFKNLADKNILDQFRAGDKVTIMAGYYDYELDAARDLAVEFTGYIREIESDYPLVVHCEDESYILRQTNFIKSYQAATLKQILTDIMPSSVTFECPDVVIGKYQIDKASAYTVLNDLVKNYGLYSRMNNGHLAVGLAYDFGDRSQVHTYTIGKDVRKNELKYKRSEDFKLRFKAVATNPNGQKTTITLGSTEVDASERTLNFAGPMSEAQLREAAKGVMAKYVYDGYSGAISGLGVPHTHAGDVLVIVDKDEPGREGKYLVEKVDITYNDSTGYVRKNTLSYKVG